MADQLKYKIVKYEALTYPDDFNLLSSSVCYTGRSLEVFQASLQSEITLHRFDYSTAEFFLLSDLHN